VQQRLRPPAPQRYPTPGVAVEPRPRPRPPRGPGSDNRVVVTLGAWCGLAVALGLWFATTPPGSVTSPAAALVEAGRIVGLVGGYVLLLQILLMTRVGWLERSVGANRLMAWHRDLGFLLLVLVLGHAVLLILGLASADESSWLHETWAVMTTYEDMISAFVATGILVGVALLAVRWVRAVMPYELWHLTHATAYVVVLLSYGHVLANGREFVDHALARWYWIGLHLFVLVNLAWGRGLSPLALNLRHRLRVGAVVAEGEDMFSIYIGGRRLDALRVRAGQFFRWRFLAGGCWWQAHPFSLSAAPNGQWLRLTIKAVGDHTGRLRWLQPGTLVIAEGPSGVFTADRRRRYRALLMAGGSGIAPIRALLEELPRGTVVIYRASSPDDLIFRRELDSIAYERAAEVHYVVGARDDPGPRRVMTARGLRRLVPDVGHRDVYICGPEGFATASTAILRRLRVPRRQIHLDPFEF